MAIDKRPSGYIYPKGPRPHRLACVAGQGVIVYLADLAPKRSLTIEFDMLARIPLAAVARPTTAYEYYQPETKTAAPGGKFQVD